MDVHRCRFVPYPAAEINALAFSHPSSPNQPTPPQLRLALGRSNGDIEIWNPLDGLWAQETILRGGKNRTIEGLAWTQDPETETAEGKKIAGKLRLFSIGYSPVVTEWDLSTGLQSNQCGGTYGDVWCIAAQPLLENRKKGKKNKVKGEKPSDQRQEQLLALGCADGSVVLLTTADGDLTYLKTLPRSSGKKPRVISLAWRGRDQIITGCSDGMIRVYDIAGRGTQKASMSLGLAGGRGKSADTLVWNIKLLRNDTFASADSTGEVKIWNANNFTLLQRIKGHLDADVLCLAASHDGSTLFSGGMDRRTTLYQVSSSGQERERGRWAAVMHQRYHQSDVKVMATFESKQMSVVVSGGADATPIVNPLRTFGQEYHRNLSPIASSPVVSSAPKARLMISWWNREVGIWSIPTRQSRTEGVDDAIEDQSPSRLVARLVIQGEDSIASAAINSTGDAVAVDTAAEVKLFHLRPSKTSKTLRVQKVDLPKSVSSRGSKRIEFSPDGKWLARAVTDNSLQLIRVVRQEGAKLPFEVMDVVTDFERRHGHPSERVGWGTHANYDHVISRLAWSYDSRILIAGDLSGNLDTWILEDIDDAERIGKTSTNGTNKKPTDNDGNVESSDEESDDEDHSQIIMGQQWKRHSARLPILPAAPLVISFRPSTKRTEAYTNGNIGVHANQNNFMHHSRDSSRIEDRLLVVTAKHEVLEYHAMSGRLTDWSRRNVTSVLPLSFRNVLDRTMGCLWDTSAGKQRAFLYGSMWIWMFDMSRDMPLAESHQDEPAAANDNVKSNAQGLKRKREHTEQDKRAMIRSNVGAGSKIPDYERQIGAGAKLVVHGGSSDTVDHKELTFNQSDIRIRDDSSLEEDEDDFEGPDDAANDDTSEEEQELALIRMRRADSDEAPELNGESHIAPAMQISKRRSPPHEWHTYKYRSVIGIVPLGNQDSGGESSGSIVKSDQEHHNNGIEVAIVERPLWDADLKARWEGPQEYGER